MRKDRIVVLAAALLLISGVALAQDGAAEPDGEPSEGSENPENDEAPRLQPPIPLGSVSAPLPPGVLTPDDDPVTLMVSLAIDETGKVTEVGLTEPSGKPELDEAALRAARTPQFFPAYQGATAVAP